MPIKISTDFDVNTSLPIDSRTVQPDLTGRNNISSSWRYEGLCVYVVSEETSYRLIGGTNNSNWIEWPISSSYSPVEPDYSSSISQLIDDKQNIISSGSFFNITSSWSLTSSNSLTSSYINFIPENSISSSWASSSLSSSYSPVEPNYSSSISIILDNKQNVISTGSTLPITSSWSINSISASWAPFSSDQLNLNSGSTYTITSSWSINSVSASWASSSLSSSYAPSEPFKVIVDNNTSRILSLSDSQCYIRFTNVTGSSITVPPESSVSWPDYTEIMLEQSSDGQINILTGSGVTVNSIFTGSSQQYSVFGLKKVDINEWTFIKTDINSPQIESGSSYNITSSYSISSSWASSSISASYSPVEPNYSSSISTILNTKQNIITTGSTFNITSSWSVNSSTASYINFIPVSSISSSWSSESLSSSYAPVQPSYSSSISTILNTKQNEISSGSSFNITSSWSLNSLTASYINFVPDNSISSSWSSQSLSSSYSPVEPIYSSSISTILNTKQNNISTGSTLPITSSWSLRSISSSYSPVQPSYSSSISTILNTKQNIITSGSIFNITSSWSNKSISSSYAPVEPDYSASISTILDSKIVPFKVIEDDTSSRTLSLTDAQSYIRFTYISGSDVTVPPESSVSWPDYTEIMLEQSSDGQINIITGSGVTIHSLFTGSSQQYSVFGLKKVDTNLWTFIKTDVNSSQIESGSSYNITSSWSINSISSSWASSSLSSSYAPVEPDYSESISTILNDKQNIIISGSTFNITSSWSNKSISASWAPFSSEQLNLDSGSTYTITSSWSVNSSTASYINFTPENSISSSWSSQSLSSSYSPVEPNYSSSISTILNTKQNIITTGSSYNITSSWSLHSISSSYSPVEPNYSASVSTILDSKSGAFKVITDSTTSRTLSLSDAQCYIRFTNISGSTVTIPPQTSVSWPNYTEIIIEQSNTGKILVTTGSSVVIHSNSTGSSGQYSVFGLKRVDADIWTFIDSDDIQPNLVSGSSYNVTSSWSLNSLTASYINFTPDNSISSSWSSQSLSSSYSPVEPDYSSSISIQLNNKQDILITGNNYTITSSWSNNSISSSYSPVQPSYSSSISTILSGKQNIIITGSTFNITSSWSDKTISSSYSPIQPSYSSSISTILNTKQNIITTGSTFNITSSWSNKTISSSYAPVEPNYSSSISTILNSKTGAFKVVTDNNTSRTLQLSDAQSYIIFTTSSIITVPPQTSVSWPDYTEIMLEQSSEDDITIITGSGVTIHSNFTGSSGQYSVFGLKRTDTDIWTFIDSGTNIDTNTLLITGSTYPITSSWSINSISSSWASSSISSSYSITSSYSLNSGTSLSTGSNYPITSSWSIKSISSSYAPVEPNYSSSISTEFNSKQNTISTGSTFNITSSWSSKTISASYAPVEPNYSSSISTILNTKQNIITSGSTFNITSSWSNKTISASYAPVQPSYSSSIATQLNSKQDTLTKIGNIYQISVISSSWADGAALDTIYSASVANQINSKQDIIENGITLLITSSKAISASYAPVESNYSSSVSILIDSKQDTLPKIGTVYTITSSWSDNSTTSKFSTSASYAPVQTSYSSSISTILNGKQNTISTGSTYNITSSWSDKSISASYAPVQPSYSSSISTILNTKQNIISTGSSYNITSSWSLSSSYCPIEPFPVIIDSTTSRTLSLTDAQCYIRFTTGSIITVPPESSVSWPDYTEIMLEQSSDEQITIVTGSGVTINAIFTGSSQQYSVFGLKKVDTDEWTFIKNEEISSDTTITTGSNYPITSSWSLNSVSSSYSPVEPAYSSSISTILSGKQNTISTGSSFNITSSWSNNSLTASYVRTLNQDVIISGSLLLSGEPNPISMNQSLGYDTNILQGSTGNSGVGYYGSVMGINIKPSLVGNIPVIQTNNGGINSAGAIHFGCDDNGSGDSFGVWTGHGAPGTKLTQSIFVTNAGKVGVGGNNADATLSIQGAGISSGNLFNWKNSGSVELGKVLDNGAFYWYPANGNGTSGGMNWSPSAAGNAGTLNFVSSQLALWGSNSHIESVNTGLRLFGSHVSGKFVYLFASTSSVPDLTVNDGKVGIGAGKTSPNATLDVSGSTIISGSLIVTGGITGSLISFTGSTVTSPSSSSISDTISNYYGSSEENILGTPDAWMKVVINGTTYKMPLYL